MTFRAERRVSGEVAQRLRSGRSVLVTGPAGIGKTTVLRAACESLDRTEPVIHAATSATASEMPLAAFAHLLATGDGTPAERIGKALAQLAAQGRTLVIDDAHHLDPESAVVIQHLVTTGAVNVVMAQRVGLTLVDALARLVRDGDVDVVEVPPLDRDEVTHLAEHHLGGLVDAATGDLLHRASGGNPLHVHELLVAAQRRELVTCHAGVWRLDRVAADGSLAELITERLAEWTPDVRTVAELIAAGSAVPLDVVTSATGPDPVARAIDTGLVRPRTADGLLELHHPLVAEVLRSELGPTRLMERLSTLVSTALGSTDPDQTTLAAWLALLAEQAPVDVHRLIDAAELLIDQARPHAALRLAEIALHIDEQAAKGVFVRANAQLGRVVPTDDPALALRAARGAVEALMFGIGSLDGARQALAAAAVSGPDEAEGAELEALALVAELICGAPLPRSIDRLLEIERRRRGELAALIAAAGVGTALVGAGRYDDAVALYDHADGSSPLETTYHRLQFALNKVEGHLGAGQVDRARIHVAQRLRNIQGPDAPTALVFGGAAEAQLMIAAGRPADAARHLGQVLSVLGPLDSVGIRTWALCTLDWCCAWAGIPGPDDLPEHPNEQGRLVFPLARLARAAAAAERGRLSSAREMAIALATECAANGHAGTALHAWHLAARIQPTTTVAQHARRMADDCQGALSELVVAHAEALAARDESRLTEVAARFGEFERSALAHEGYLQAARIAADDGRRSRAAGLRAQAVAALNPGTRPTFASRLGGGAIGGVQLTAREHEIAVAAAAGASNAEIADQLGISRRTVETHLQAVYRKVGVSDRTTLAALLS